MKALLRVPAFCRLVVAYTLNELAWAVGTLALSILVYRRTGSALGATGFYLCSQVIPGVLAPVLVAKLDRYPPRRLLPLLYWIEAVLFGVLAWMTSRFAVVPVLALALADGAIAITARSLTSAARAEILKPIDLLHEGNALTNGAFTVVFMVGPLIGGGVVALGGTVTALIANCALFAVMGLVLVSDSLPGAFGAPGPSRGRLRAALTQVRGDRLLFALLVLQTVGMVFFTISVPIEVVYASHTLHAGAGGYGAILSAWGGGAVVGSLLLARWRRSTGRNLLGGSSLVIAAGFAILAIAPSLAVALVGAAVAGVANGILSVAFQTEIQNLAPSRWMAVVTSLSQASMQLAPGAGILLGGAIAAVASTRVAWGVAGAGSLAFAIAIAIVLAPGRLTRPTAPPVAPPDGDQPRAARHETLV